MPTYEYQCEKCDEVFEVRQKFADEPLTTHEVCGGAVHRLLSAPALQFKGSGFYITDYAKGSGGAPGNKQNANGQAESGGGEKSGEKNTGDKVTSGKASSDKGSSDKGSSDKGSTTPATSTSSSTSDSKKSS